MILHSRPLILIFFAFIILAGCKPGPLHIQPGKTDAEMISPGSRTILDGPSILHDPARYVWGASVVQGDDGLYHMFYSTWEAGKDSLTFGDSWVLNSNIGYACSEYPDKLFISKGIVLRGRIHDGDSTAWDAQMVHNPHIKRFREKYYLYYIGSRDPGIQKEGSPGDDVNKRNRVQQCQKIGVIEFEHFEDLLAGTFVRPDKPLLSPRTRVKKDQIVNPSPAGTEAKPDNIVVVNPSVVFRPSDKKYLLYFKGNLYDPHWRGVHGVAVSDAPTGPFTAMDSFVFDIRMEDDRIASAEDPYVWYSRKYKGFFAVIKDFTGRIGGVKSGLALLESKDGITWRIPENSLFMEREVTLSDETTIPVVHLERPQLLLDRRGIPLVLFAACAVESPFGKSTHNSFNVHIPLQSSF
jgi:hypothetical protein